MHQPKDKISEQVFELLCEQIQALFKEAETQNLTPKEFAIKIWFKTVFKSIPEKTLTSILFEKSANISPAETYQLIENLTYRSIHGESTAIQRAVTLIIDGLALINEAENEISSK